MRLRRTAALLVAVALGTAACAPATGAAPGKAAPGKGTSGTAASGTAASGTSAPGQGAPASATAAAPKSLLHQTAEQRAATAASLRQVDDLPLYEMTYHGGYEADAPMTEAELARREDGWACSLFLRGTEFGRNFDWHANPAMVVHADPPDGYASISLVDAFYVLNRKGPADLKADARRLAHAVLVPFDGMNEKGLAIGLATTPTAILPKPAGRTTVSSARIIRLILDRAATVREAVELMGRYHLDFSSGIQVHYLIADRSGDSVVVEYGDGKLNVIDDDKLTNITMAGTTVADRLRDTRYRTLAESPAGGLDLLSQVAQGHTRWSVVYDLAKLDARLVTAKRWERVHTFRLSSPG
ncbi:linear amide C-N hydrolase [Nonomuraea sp. NPDC050328]|uniref:linear amide C-N hydrolase n=1 Tax=Nonomuraea sp. NPDC050328 TaxID=3364361 RepID=UPI00379B2D46